MEKPNSSYEAFFFCRTSKALRKRYESGPRLALHQKRLLHGVMVGPVEGPATGHRAHGELPDLPAFAPDLGDRLIPVDLGFLAPRVDLRHERLVHEQAQLALAAAHVPPHARLRHRRLGPLLADPLPDAMHGVPLLARSVLVDA